MTTLLSMDLHQGSSWITLVNTQLQSCKNLDRPPSSLHMRSHNTSAKQNLVVQQQQWKREPVLRNQVSAFSHTLVDAFTKDFRTTSTLRIHQHNEKNSILSCCNQSGSRTMKNLKRIRVYQRRDADVVLHSMGLVMPKKCRIAISGQIQWRYGVKDLAKVSVSNPGTKRKKWEVGVGVGEDMPAKYQADDPLKQIPQRRCGILFHPTSLPGPHGIGDLGKDAYNFVDWLKETGCTVWQVLPLVPPGRRGGEDGSPYAGADANCGNTLLISLEGLVRDGLLKQSDLPKAVAVKRMNCAKVAAVKDPLVTKAAAALVGLSSGKLKDQLDAFRKDPKIASWVEEAALFAAIDQSTKTTTWWTWPSHLRDRDPNAMKAARTEHKSFIDIFVAAQFLFQRQWQALHKYTNNAGIKILGDMPMYVGGHSADVWAHRSCFDLDPKTGAPVTVSGVPPDGFSPTGQLWGSPLYNWKEMAKDKYSWWATRILRAYELFDEFRIDHFRGFAGYWAIPATAQTAISGKWKAGPGKAFFTAMAEAVGKRIDIVAEDLGIITTDVVALRKDLHAPGMAVLQFAYSNNSRNPHLLHNHEFDQVVYPGTHDNDTCVGWWKKATEEEKVLAKKYLRFYKNGDVHWEFIRSATASVAKTAIIPMQDVLGLDNNARMNIPATQAGNWGWRIGESDVFSKSEKEKKRLRKFLCRYNRLTPEFQEKCRAEKMAKSKRSTTTTKDDESTASSMARTLGKSFESLRGMSLLGEAKDEVDNTHVDKTHEKVTKEAPGTFEKFKEKLKEQASRLKDKTLKSLPIEDDKSKDEKSKEKHEHDDKSNDEKTKEKKPKHDNPKEKPKDDKPSKEKHKHDNHKETHKDDKFKEKFKHDKSKENFKDGGKHKDKPKEDGKEKGRDNPKKK